MKRILIGAPVRQDHTTFYKYLKALNQLDTDGIKVDFFFILHNSPRLKRFLKPNQFVEFESLNEYKRDNHTHHWTNENLKDVAIMKNALLRYVTDNKYDYFFLVDSDLILQPQTLKQLLSREVPIVAEVFWTKWTPDTDEQPNAWMFDYYGFHFDRQYEEFRKHDFFRVGMSGACILIKRNVIDSGVNYSPIHNVSYSLWEDRAFCIRAAVHGWYIYLDTTCPPEHLYRQKPVAPSSNKAKQGHLRK
jgi:hypothetical protein